MTLAEMQQMTLANWATHHRAKMKALGRDEALKQAAACARLTRIAMDELKVIGLDEDTAWTETRGLYCFASPPTV